MRHRIPQLGIFFSSDGYAAGYYSYLWADVISTDVRGFTEGKQILRTGREEALRKVLAWEILQIKKML
jgi:Zn-dependent oligopeptidase